jgi:hypothetical protein
VKIKKNLRVPIPIIPKATMRPEHATQDNGGRAAIGRENRRDSFVRARPLRQLDFSHLSSVANQGPIM